MIFFGANAKLAKATLPGANFSKAYLANLDFQNIEGKALQGANFNGACLVNCRFNGTVLLNVNLAGACLRGADFTDAKLFGTPMTDAAVATAGGKVVINRPDTVPIPPFVSDLPTEIAPSSTDGSTTCPSSDNGPCAGDAWKAPRRR